MITMITIVLSTPIHNNVLFILGMLCHAELDFTKCNMFLDLLLC